MGAQNRGRAWKNLTYSEGGKGQEGGKNSQ